MEKKKAVYFYVLPAVFVFAGVAFASGGEGAESGKWLNLLYRIINFAIVAGILYYFLGKKAAAFFSGRSKAIEASLHDLDQRRIDAEARLQEVEARIANLAEEKENILRQAREQGEAVKANIISEAEKAAQRIRAQAEMAVDQEVQQALAEVRGQVADQIVLEAEKIIRGQLKKKEHEKLINESLKKVVLH